jgi:glycosyltransferase involved in cell wall biosynthesis
MKIVHINASTSGGAYRSSVGLHKGLLNLSIDSTFFTGGTAGGPNFVRYQKTTEGKAASFFNRLRFKWITHQRSRYRFERFGQPSYFEDPAVAWGPKSRFEFPQADIFHLHDLKQFVDYKNFFGRLFSRHAIVWTLHDMTPFTGGCDYDYGCGRFLKDCGKCPALNSVREDDLSRANLRIKLDLFSKLDPALVKIVSPSKWLAREAQSSRVLGRFETTVIPNGINTEDFAPRGRNSIRESLDIAPDEFVMLVLATRLDDYRKGFHLLASSLSGLDPGIKFTLLCAGHGGSLQIPGIRTIHAGSFSNDRMLSMIYSAADVFVLTSLAEAFGNVAVESLACGTPVVAFETGGIPDIVEHANTGLLARTGDIEQIRKHLNHLAKERQVLRNMSEKCRETALKKFSINQQAAAHLAIYRQLFQRATGVPAKK